MNVISFTGNLGSDADLRYTPDGTAVASISVPIKSGFGKSEKVNWAKCTIWGKRADTLAQYLVKGALVGVVGELSLDEYVSKDGTNKAQLAVKVNEITLLGKPVQAKVAQKYDRDDVQTDDNPFGSDGDRIPF